MTAKGDAEVSGVVRGGGLLARWIDHVALQARRSALFFDIDGTISPIAPTPEEAIVPEPTRELLRRLIPVCGLVGFVTGRALEDGRRRVGLDGAAYVGNHGLDVLRADGRPLRDERAEQYVPLMREAIARAREAGLERLGVVLEDKRTVLAMHYRPAVDRDAARDAIEDVVAEPARERGLRVYYGRLATELRPPLDVSKGDAVRILLADGDYATAAFCGDDVTDVDGCRAVDEWEREGDGRLALTLAVVGDETAPEVRDGSRVWVDGTGGLTNVVTALLERLGA